MRHVQRNCGRSPGGPSGEHTGGRGRPVTHNGGTVAIALLSFWHFRGITSLLAFERPQQDSNLRTRLRRPLLYPLSYGGFRTE